MFAMERTYKFIIGKPVYMNSKEKTDISKLANGDNNGNAFLIEDLHMTFEVSKDNTPHPNKGYVSIFNLSDDVVNYLDTNQRESLACMLYAGYNYDNQLIFSGTVEFIEDKFDNETRETKFILGDAVVNITTAMTARSYKKGTPMDTVIKELSSDLGLPVGRIVGFKNATLQHSMAFCGSASQNLTNLAKNTNSNFSVQDGAVYWTKQGARFGQSVFEISEEAGMIGSPTPKNPHPRKTGKTQKTPDKTKPHTGKDSAQTKEDTGLVVKTLLNGAILPEMTVYLKSRRYTGFYKVIQLKHSGGFESGDWVTELGLAETRGKLME